MPGKCRVTEAPEGHTCIEECAVVGLADLEKGEIPAYVALREGASISMEEFDAYFRQHLAAYKVPRRVEFIQAQSKNLRARF